MKFNKKAAMELSINAIVVLILAIIMLGIGIAFMKGMFSKTIGDLGDISAGIKNDMIEQIRSSNQKFEFKENDVKMKVGEQKETYYGIKNVMKTSGTESNDFAVSFYCDKAMDSTIAFSGDETGKNSADPITFDYFEEQTINGNEVYVGKLIVKASSTAKATTYSCKGTIEESGIEYASKRFYITLG